MSVGPRKEIRDEIKLCFDNCDSARYAKSAITKEGMINTMELLEKIIDKLERSKR